MEQDRNIIYLKQSIRKEAHFKRDGLSAEYRRIASLEICNILKDMSKNDTVLAGYYPIGSEVDVLPFIRSIQQQYAVGLPAYDPDSNEFIFRQWDTDLKKGQFGIPEPDRSSQILTPTIILVPLLGFDKDLNRIGYGRGYYDKILRRYHKATKIGCAFAIQEFSHIPQEDHDIKLDYIVTENTI